MAIIDELKTLAPVAQASPPASSWVKDLIDKRYQPKTERLKRSPVGFNFTREPFDPSSYYDSMGSYRDISRAATEVVKQEAANRKQAEYEAAQAARQKAIDNAIKNIDPRFVYDNGKGYNGGKNSGGRNYKLGGVSSNTASAANYFGNKYGIGRIGGRGPGSVPGSDHPHGRALDFMTSNKAKGTALANDVIKNYKAWNVKYVIWYRYIWSPGRGWRKYSGPSAHTDHVHVSFNK